MMPLPVRSVLVAVKGADGRESEVLISPGSKIERGQYQVSWNISDIVAPNLFHHAGVPKARSAYPQARAWGVPGSRAKRSDISWNAILGEDAWPYVETLLPLPIAGMPKFNEMVFIHKPSRSLIVTDLCFNMRNISGLAPRLIMSLFGNFNKFAVSRLFMSYAKNRVAFRESLARVLEHDFENIIVSHGENLIGDAKNELRRALDERGIVL